jgi:hypothetical protein
MKYYLSHREGGTDVFYNIDETLKNYAK